MSVFDDVSERVPRGQALLVAVLELNDVSLN
jgi:hypothetical protein